MPETAAWTAPELPVFLRRTETAQRFEFIPSTTDLERSDVQAAWHRLLQVRRSPEKLYQLPAFFKYLQETKEDGAGPCELHVIRRCSDTRIVGIVPGRRMTQKVSVRLGPLTVFKRTVPVYQLLGSVPLIDAGEEGLSSFVLNSLLQRHPDCQALLMQAMPEELAHTVGGKGLSRHVLNGWQNCHTVPLPEDVETYLQKFSSKKRYNLSRQVRLLAKEAGEVSLVRIEHPDQVPALVDAMRTLMNAEDFSVQSSQVKLENLARNGLLHSYLLQCGGKTVALVLGTHSDEVWHVHNICCAQEYMNLSIGTSIIHLALQDAIVHFNFTHADFGYGTPNQEFRSTHVLQRRGKLLLCRRHGMADLLFKLYSVQNRMNEALIARVKTARKRLKERRQASK
ncbi:GNAT family N-acetyltransferase [Massilia sp. 2TAF26]|uniref:GNAT family N-acetyltransferase n=1 Tax=Massilia sp. 2TAF26 TaxID=3233012 RepID=UPI003F949A75